MINSNFVPSPQFVTVAPTAQGEIDKNLDVLAYLNKALEVLGNTPSTYERCEALRSLRESKLWGHRELPDL